MSLSKTSTKWLWATVPPSNAADKGQEIDANWHCVKRELWDKLIIFKRNWDRSFALYSEDAGGRVLNFVESWLTLIKWYIKL